MTAQLLTSELSTLLQESKRKNPDLKAAVEKSLNDLNALPRTSEAQIVADLKCRPAFVRPFLIACNTRNPKFAGNAVSCLQRLIVANALPQETLGDVLEALRECSALALDVQLKVLQALPSLLQNYADTLTGPLLVAAFQVCFLLYGNKTAVVANLAAAALQQFIESTFEKAALKEGAANDTVTSEVFIDTRTIRISGARLDAYRVLDDMCLLIQGQKPRHIQGATLAQNFGLELAESILSNHGKAIAACSEQIHVLRIQFMPFLIKVLSEKSSFTLTVRVMRLVKLTLCQFLIPLAPECETMLSLLNHMLDPDAAYQWKRVLCLETFRTLHADTTLVRKFYALFDDADSKRNIIRDHLGALVRLASEKPAVIGLGHESSAPSASIDDSGEQAALQAGGLVGSIGATVNTVELNTPGISTRWSNVKTPLIEQLDKADPAAIPTTYIYSLVLTCLTSFEEGIARFLLPFTVASQKRTRKKQGKTQDADQSVEDAHLREEIARIQIRKTAINPLILEEHPQYAQIMTSAHMVEQCWPALLAASSTFFNASMDSENFHALIRSFQKFTQIAGLLGFATPRDAFLTTLGKQALPSSRLSKTTPTPTSARFDIPAMETDSSRDASPAPGTLTARRRQSLELIVPTMNSRHLLCLRALLNLGIALAPVLQRSWTIIMQVLQQADLLLVSLRSGRQNQRIGQKSENGSRVAADDDDDMDDIGLEVTAAETAALRLFENTSELNSSAFLDLLYCLRDLLGVEGPAEREPNTSVGTLSPNPGVRRHQKLRSVSGTAVESTAASHDSAFVLSKVQEVVKHNVWRLVQPDSTMSGLDLLSDTLMEGLASVETLPEIRFESAATLNQMLIFIATFNDLKSRHQIEAIRARSLSSVVNEINSLYQSNEGSSKHSRHCELEIHRSALDALRAILEHCGDSLTNGWTDVLAIIASAVEQSHNGTGNDPRSQTLIRSAFGSLELVISDFLSSVPQPNMQQLLDTLYSFSSQNYDLNISLTTATFFRTTSDYLLRDETVLTLENLHIDSSSTSNSDNSSKISDDSSPILLWLFLLTYLVKLSVDSRMEARHSALHTIFRILDANVERLSVSSLPSVREMIVDPILVANRNEYSKVLKQESEGSARDMDKTAVVLVDEVAKFLSQLVDTFGIVETNSEMFVKLFTRLGDFLQQRRLELTTAVFGGMSKMLAEFEDQTNEAMTPSIEVVWHLWGKFNPAEDTISRTQLKDNNDAILAHLYCLGQLLRLGATRLRAKDAQLVIKQLHESVLGATSSKYTTDVESMTPVQKAIFESLKMLPRIDDHCDRLLLDLLSDLINLPYRSRDKDESSCASFVALSKAVMAVLQAFVEDRLRAKTMQAGSTLPSIALSALQEPLRLKYKWQLSGKEPSTWRKATTTAVDILKMSIPILRKSSSDGQAFWNTAVNIMDSVISADCAACTKKEKIQPDEAFDIDAFNSIKLLYIPALGSTSIPKDVQSKFAESIYRNSLIHEPNDDDLARPDEDLLDGLKREHFGRVCDLPPSPRSRMPYLLLDELFDLVAVHDGSLERVRLSQAAAPYLILRIGLVLKAYIYDQPLRGRMPQMWSEKKEIFYVLRKMLELRSEPKAMPEGRHGGGAQHKKHLYRLYPLILRAMKAAWRDEEMVERLTEVLEAIGDDMQTDMPT